MEKRDRKNGYDKPITLHPLTVKEALKKALDAGPAHRKDEPPEKGEKKQK